MKELYFTVYWFVLPIKKKEENIRSDVVACHMIHFDYDNKFIKLYFKIRN